MRLLLLMTIVSILAMNLSCASMKRHPDMTERIEHLKQFVEELDAHGYKESEDSPKK